jgi:nitric oxide reductase subunit B
MNNGSIWGHGGYLGPDYSAQYLHTLAVHAAETLSRQRFNQPVAALTAEQRAMIEALVRSELKENRFDPDSDTLTITDAEAESYLQRIRSINHLFPNSGQY